MCGEHECGGASVWGCGEQVCGCVGSMSVGVWGARVWVCGEQECGCVESKCGRVGSKSVGVWGARVWGCGNREREILVLIKLYIHICIYIYSLAQFLQARTPGKNIEKI